MFFLLFQSGEHESISFSYVYVISEHSQSEHEYQEWADLTTTWTYAI
jgi:hypothetical protein